MNSATFRHAENSIPARDVDRHPYKVFVTPVSIVGDRGDIIQNKEEIQAFIKKDLTDAGVELAETNDEAKMRLNCTVTLNPVHESKVPTESLQPNTEYSSIVVKIQVSQEDKIQHRQPYYYNSGICIEPDENVMACIKNCLKEILQKLTRKK